MAMEPTREGGEEEGVEGEGSEDERGDEGGESEEIEEEVEVEVPLFRPLPGLLVFPNLPTLSFWLFGSGAHSKLHLQCDLPRIHAPKYMRALALTHGRAAHHKCAHLAAWFSKSPSTCLLVQLST